MGVSCNEASLSIRKSQGSQTIVEYSTVSRDYVEVLWGRRGVMWVCVGMRMKKRARGGCLSFVSKR